MNNTHISSRTVFIEYCEERAMPGQTGNNGKSIGLLISLALLLAGCASTDATFEQHSYEEMEFRRTARADARDATWLQGAQQAAEAATEHGWDDVAQVILVGTAAPMRELQSAHARAAYLSSDEGRPALMALSGLPHLSEATRAAMPPINVAAAEGAGGIGYATSMGELTHAGIGFFGGAIEGLDVGLQMLSGASCSGSDPLGGALCATFVIGVLGVATVGGAVIGAVEAEGNRQGLSARETFVAELQEELGDVRPLAELVMQVERELGVHANLQPAEQLAGGQLPPFTPASFAARQQPTLVIDDLVLPGGIPEDAGMMGFDRLVDVARSDATVLEINLRRIGLFPIREGGDIRYSFGMIAEMTLLVPLAAGHIPHPDEAVMHVGETRYVVVWRRLPLIMPSHSFDDWLAGGSAFFGEEMDFATARLAERIADYAGRLERGEAQTDGGRTVAASLAPLPTAPGEARVTFVDDLAWAMNPFDFGPMPSDETHRQDNSCAAVQLRTLYPEFTWDPQPGAASYDLRIYDGGLREVHHVNGVGGESYVLPVPLERSRNYYWTVRARFDEEATARVSDWARCGAAAHDLPFVDDMGVTAFYPFRAGRN
jgi:hypothetical protein